ncbi:hypothetical protein HYU18_03660 [Candidatus Woesearchaeota archaeon]|nr:hypothetical protein [Candidatus Woesearchaeota archaeon]
MAIAKLEELADSKDGLTRRDRWMTPAELRVAYSAIYHDMPPGKWDGNFQQKRPMPPEAIDAELGPDMAETYQFLVREFAFHHLGERMHNTFEGLGAHYWNIAFRAALMGLPLQVRQLALTHSIPEHKGRGILEARRTIKRLTTEFGSEVGTNIDALVFEQGIIVDHLFHNLRRGGNDIHKKPFEYLRERLNDVRDGYPAHDIEEALREAMKLSPDSKGRIVPLLVAGELPLHAETRARLHRAYAKKLNDANWAQLIQRDPYKDREVQQHDHAILVIKSLCFIDRIRTASEATIERVSREAMDFIPFLDEMLAELHLRDSSQNRLIYNPLEFVASALKTELLREVGSIMTSVANRRESSFKQLGGILATRYAQAESQYGRTAARMGYVPIKVAPTFSP